MPKFPRRAFVLAVGLALGVLGAVPPGALRADDGAATALADQVETELRRVHYARVERELTAAPTEGLTDEQRAARTSLIAALRAYRERGDFGRNRLDSDRRLHLFVDDDGRRCAVAELLHVTGEDGLVSDVARADNLVHVAELADDARFRRWLDRCGLTLEEAARIQAPAYPEGAETRPAPGPMAASNSNSGGTREPTDDPNGGKEPASDKSKGGESSAGGDPAASPPTAGAASGHTIGGRGAPRTQRAGADAWWMWWEFGKLEFLRPAHDVVALSPRTVTAGVTLDDAMAREARRDEVLMAVRPLLADADPAVRASAVTTIGRLAGAAFTDGIIALLRDPAPEVRSRAILALGAAGSARAAQTLLAIARTGRAAKDGDDLGPDARPLAILALGMARRRGLAQDFSAEIAAIFAEAKRRDAEDLGTAAEFHAALAPADGLVTILEAAATDRNAPDALRARHIELAAVARPLPATPAVVRGLQDALAGRGVETRRSAAIALGRTEHELVAPHLMTAFEVEREPLARGFLLIAIGRRGGDRAKTFLAEQMNSGDAALRPWAALASALIVRRADAPELRAAIRSADIPDGARCLALGLAGDAASVEKTGAILREAAAPADRLYAAAALGLIGGDEAHDVLVSALVHEKDEQIRTEICQALGGMGRPADAARIAGALAQTKSGRRAAHWGAAAGFHRTEEMLTALMKLVADPATTPAARAAAVEGLGLLLDPAPRPTLPALLRDANFAVMPSWLRTALTTTL